MRGTSAHKPLFCHAAFENQPDILRMLLEHPSIDPLASEERGANAVFAVVSECRAEALCVLLASGKFDLDANWGGMTLLMVAAMSDNVACFKQLVACVDVMLTIEGRTALHVALTAGAYNVVAMLAEEGPRSRHEMHST